MVVVVMVVVYVVVVMVMMRVMADCSAGDSDRGGDDWLMAVNDGGDYDDGNDGDGDNFYDNFQGNDIKILFND